MSDMKEIQTVSDYLSVVKNAEQEWEEELLHDKSMPPDEKKTVKFFYRGQENSSWVCLPSLFRKRGELAPTKTFKRIILGYEESLYREEPFLIQEAQRRYPDVFRLAHTDLEKLAVAQHHRIPTRLLDVSGNALVALYFAAKNLEVDGKVGIFRASAYDYQIASTLGLTHESLWANYQKPNVTLRNPKKKPILVFPPFMSERQKAQDGAFFLFENQGENDCITGKESFVCEFHKGDYRELIIPMHAKIDILSELESKCGICDDRLFPESLEKYVPRLVNEAVQRILSK